MIMKYSASSPYPNLMQCVLHGGWLGVSLLITAFVAVSTAISVFYAECRLHVALYSLLFALIGASLIARCKLDNISRSVWFSFGSGKVRPGLRKTYRIGYAFFLPSVLICALLLLSLL